MSFSSPYLEREGFSFVEQVFGLQAAPTFVEQVFGLQAAPKNLTTPVGTTPTTYEENWHGTFRSANPC